MKKFILLSTFLFLSITSFGQVDQIEKYFNDPENRIAYSNAEEKDIDYYLEYISKNYPDFKIQGITGIPFNRNTRLTAPMSYCFVVTTSEGYFVDFPIFTLRKYESSGDQKRYVYDMFSTTEHRFIGKYDFINEINYNPYKPADSVNGYYGRALISHIKTSKQDKKGLIRTFKSAMESRLSDLIEEGDETEINNMRRNIKEFNEYVDYFFENKTPYLRKFVNLKNNSSSTFHHITLMFDDGSEIVLKLDHSVNTKVEIALSDTFKSQRAKVFSTSPIEINEYGSH